MASRYLIAGVAGVVTTALAALGIWYYGQTQYRAGVQAEITRQAQIAAQINTENRKVKNDVDAKKDGAFDRYIEERDKAVAAANDARSELDRLRNDLKRYQRGAGESRAPECRTDEASALSRGLEEIGARHQESSRDAELDAQQVIGLQEYIKSISTLCIEKGTAP